MSLTETPAAPRPAAKRTTKRIGTKVKAALDAMVWDGLTWQDAARKANLSLQSMRMALRAQHVITYLRNERDVLRTSLSTRANFRMVELSEQDGNRAAAVSATKELMYLEDQSHSAGTQRQSPGLTIIIEGAHHSRDVRVIDDKPLISLDPVRNGDDEGQR